MFYFRTYFLQFQAPDMGIIFTIPPNVPYPSHASLGTTQRICQLGQFPGVDWFPTKKALQKMQGFFNTITDL